jgi:hypothetical protein
MVTAIRGLTKKKLTGEFRHLMLILSNLTAAVCYQPDRCKFQRIGEDLTALSAKKRLCQQDHVMKICDLIVLLQAPDGEAEGVMEVSKMDFLTMSLAGNGEVDDDKLMPFNVAGIQYGKIFLRP